MCIRDRAYTGAADLPASVELGVGELDLDLSGLDLRTDRDLAIKLGAGTVTLHLPAATTSDTPVAATKSRSTRSASPLRSSP